MDRLRGTQTSVRGLFDRPEDVEAVLRQLTAAGVPRDLVEIVVSRQAATRFYGGAVPVTGRQGLRYAAIGGFAGLVGGAGLSLVVIALPGFATTRELALVQLIGPNVAAILGAAVGAVVGAFVPRRPAALHVRAAQAPSSILVVVRIPDARQQGVLARLLTEAGGHDVVVEA